MGFLTRLFSGHSDGRTDSKDAGAALFGRTILVLESSLTICRVIELMLTETGANALTFATKEEFLTGLSSTAPDIAILSVTELGDDVYSFVEQIKSQFPSTKIVLLTDISNPIGLATASQRGVDEVSLKPFNAVKLLGSLSQLVQ